MKKISPISIHWHRRDLRIEDHPALQRLHESKTPWFGIFFFDEKFLSRKDFSHNRFAVFLNTLQYLQNQYQKNGGQLLVVNETPQIALPQIIKYFQGQSITVEKLTFNRDYEPYARTRDQEIQELLFKLKVPCETFQDHLIFEPQSILKNDGSFYQIFTPYSRRWMQEFEKQEYPLTTHHKIQFHSLKLSSSFPYQDHLLQMLKKNMASVTIPIPEFNATTISKKIKKLKANLQKYQQQRDFPAQPGTSQLSMHLKNGSITTQQILEILEIKKVPKDSGAQTFLKELIWREFYYSILWHRPDVEKNAFNKKYQNIKWENNKKLFQHWCNGTTGFPIIDAGMRELNETGWMHNRVRMIVASFLTKDLLIDWRWGEKYFMEKLVDGDLAANNGGWQWAASTGCDPQPYFRVFNPWLQSLKFDPDAEYIHHFVPELRKIAVKNIHQEDAERGPDYPKPIVRHSVQKMRALMLYKNL